MNEIIVRAAVENDHPTLLKFEQLIIAAERPMDSTLKPDPISYYDLKALIQSKNAEVVVAEIDHTIIATGYAKILDAKEYYKHSQYVYLGYMCVLPEYRGRGINKKIIDYLVDWSLAKGMHEIRLEVYDENSIAIKAYEKVGFKKNIVEMRMEV